MNNNEVQATNQNGFNLECLSTGSGWEVFQGPFPDRATARKALEDNKHSGEFRIYPNLIMKAKP